MLLLCGPKLSRLYITSAQCKFALNAAVDTLPHNANLHLWNKEKSAACPLCGECQSLIHVLNCCSVVRDLWRYNSRHDGVPRVTLEIIKTRLKPTTKISADIDIDGNYTPSQSTKSQRT